MGCLITRPGPTTLLRFLSPYTRLSYTIQSFIYTIHMLCCTTQMIVCVILVYQKRCPHGRERSGVQFFMYAKNTGFHLYLLSVFGCVHLQAHNRQHTYYHIYAHNISVFPSLSLSVFPTHTHTQEHTRKHSNMVSLSPSFHLLTRTYICIHSHA